MTTLGAWVEANWFNAIQTAGIIGGLFMTASAAHRESKAREVQNLLSIAENHRELWGKINQNRELDRIFKSGADVLNLPPSVLEEETLNQIFLHFQTTWRIARVGGLISLHELSSDVRGFFSL